MLSPFALRVQGTLRKYGLIDERDRVLVAVSGGADSACLLLVLKELGVPLAVVHLNHGLRGADSDQDEMFTRDLAATLKVPFFVRRTQIADEPGNLEDAGRRARKEFFREVAHRERFTKVAVAHTREDRAETFLLNLFRGAGLEGLVSMPPISGEIIRPLIEVGRQEVEDYLRERGQSWRTDVTNRDLSFARNRVRHVVIPTLAAEFNPRLVETLSRTIQIVESEDAGMRALVEEWLNKNGAARGDEFVVHLGALAMEPEAFVRRIVRGALRRAGSSLDRVGFDHIEAVRSLLGRGNSGKRVEIPGGMVVERSFDTLIIRRNRPPVAEYNYELAVPGHASVPEIGMTFSAEFVDRLQSPDSRLQVPGSEPANPGVWSLESGVKTLRLTALVDADMLGPCVRIRNWRPGDFYRPAGRPAGKLKRLFQRARIPRSQRQSWPVLVSNSDIVWVASFPVSRDFVPSARSRKIVAIEVSPLL